MRSTLPSQAVTVDVRLLCGADVLASMTVPGVWEDPAGLLEEFGVVCLVREGTDISELLGSDDKAGSAIPNDEMAPTEALPLIPSSKDPASELRDVLFR